MAEPAGNGKDDDGTKASLRGCFWPLDNHMQLALGLDSSTTRLVKVWLKQDLSPGRQ